MTLDELITALEAADPTLVLPHGFTNPHSYRGYYEDLAFEPTTDVLVADMLTDARDALGETFEGWKGGQYKMRRHTDCWLAEEGHLGETISALLLGFMLDAGVRAAARQAAGQPAEDTIGLCGYCGVPKENHHHGYVSTAAALAAAPHRVTAAVEQPAEAQPAEAHPPREQWTVELLDVDGWMPTGLARRDRDVGNAYLVGRRKQRPDATFRLVRETTTWTVEETR